jgi:IPTL-CTERM motif
MKWILCLLSLVVSIIPTGGQCEAPSASWSSPSFNLSTSGRDAEKPQIALSSDGTRAMAIWDRQDGVRIVQASSATIVSNLATWSTPISLSVSGFDAQFPKVSLSSDGLRATAVWSRFDGLTPVIQASSATIAGNTATWASPINLSLAGQTAQFPQISLSSDGTKATAVWERFNGSNVIIQSASATITGNTATWASSIDLSVAGQNSTAPQISISSDGTKATAVWDRYNGSNHIIQSASATITGNTATWSIPIDLSGAGRNAIRPQISISSDGTRATAVWERFNGSNFIIQSSSATIAGNTATWSYPSDLSAVGADAYLPQVSLSSDGLNATAVWSRFDGQNDIVQSSSSTITKNAATWSTPSNLSVAGRNTGSPQISLSSDGTRAAAIWIIDDGANANYIIQSSSATIAGNTATWAIPIDLTVVGQDAIAPQISLSSDGMKASGVWEGFIGTDVIIQTKSALISYLTAPPQPIPTLSEWAQILMMLAMIATAGFYGWRMKQR